jgi:hypothetical protein
MKRQLIIMSALCVAGYSGVSEAQLLQAAGDDIALRQAEAPLSGAHADTLPRYRLWEPPISMKGGAVRLAAANVATSQPPVTNRSVSSALFGARATPFGDTDQVPAGSVRSRLDLAEHAKPATAGRADVGPSKYVLPFDPATQTPAANASALDEAVMSAHGAAPARSDVEAPAVAVQATFLPAAPAAPLDAATHAPATSSPAPNAVAASGVAPLRDAEMPANAVQGNLVSALASPAAVRGQRYADPARPQAMTGVANRTRATSESIQPAMAAFGSKFQARERAKPNR